MSEQSEKHTQGKSRILVVIVAAVVVLAVIIGAWVYISKKHTFQSSAHVASSPDIDSLPGVGNPSNVYVKAQNQQNSDQAKEAMQKGGSFVPTLTRPDFQGFSDSDDGDNQTSSIIPTPLACPVKKVVYMYKPNPSSCDLGELRRAFEAGVSAEELVCQSCSCSSLLAAGYTVGDLKAIGYSTSQLHQCGASLKNLLKAGSTATELKAAGFTAKELHDSGFSAGEVASAGFPSKETKEAGFTPAQLLAAGIGLPKNTSGTECTPDMIKQARLKHVSATVLKSKGCSLDSLKAAGYTAAELRNAGFIAAELKKGGFSAQELKDAGFSAKEMKEAGFSTKDLKNAGFSASDLKAAGFNAGAIKAAGFSAEELKNAGFTATELRNAGGSAKSLKDAGFSIPELKKAGYSKGSLFRAGFTPEEAGYILTPEKVPPAQVSQTDAANNPFNAFSGGQSSSIPSVTRDKQLQDIQNTEANLFSQEQRQAVLQQIQSNMANQAKDLLTEWSKAATQGYQEGVPNLEKTGANGNAGNTKPSGPIIKAGTIYFAILDTGINSDEQSPILATIVTGPLKGSKVIGKFALQGKKVVVNFTTINIPQFERSLSVDTVAIDQNTARTALADHVDSHFLLRYGALFASSFLAGISEGLLSSTQDETNIAGIIDIKRPKNNLSPEQYVLLGLGKAGEKYSDEVGNSLNIPPTVRVEAGAGIGLLFLSDAQLPDPLFNQSKF